ncbi:MAG TPA: hypothetical protein DD376_02590, partial [Sutterella sp.]|nr:hypothetical protein [Sutterella sp.]
SVKCAPPAWRENRRDLSRAVLKMGHLAPFKRAVWPRRFKACHFALNDGRFEKEIQTIGPS